MTKITDQIDLDDLSPAERELKIKQFLVCPVCGYDGNPTEGDGFRFLEDITVFRPIVAIRDGLIKIQGAYASGEGYDDGTAWRLECRRRVPHNCGNEWPVPDWLMPHMDWLE